MIKNYNNAICIDPSVNGDTYIWFKDGFLRVHGSFEEEAEKIYNLTTVKLINEDNTEEIVQTIKIYLDCIGIGTYLKDILETKYNLVVNKCHNYKNDLKLDKQCVVHTKDIKSNIDFQREYEYQWIK